MTHATVIKKLPFMILEFALLVEIYMYNEWIRYLKTLENTLPNNI